MEASCTAKIGRPLGNPLEFPLLSLYLAASFAPETKVKLPFRDLSLENQSIRDELLQALTETLDSGTFILGPKVAAFEAAVAERVGTRVAVGVASGSDALVIGLRALGVGPGDEEITSPFTFVATPEAIVRVGARPVFVDIDQETLALDPQRVEDAITPRTRALLPVHVFGRVADMASIMDLARRHGLVVLEDAAQAMGAKLDGRSAGSLGHAAAFSFFPTKNLGALGDGGMLTTDSLQVAEIARSLRQHGKVGPGFEEVGYNSRLDALQAAVLLAKLPHLERWTAERRAIAAQYAEAFRGMDGVTCPLDPGGDAHVFHQYAVRVAGGRREVLAAWLASRGVETKVYYSPLASQFAGYGVGAGALPVAERAAAELLCLPVYGGMAGGVLGELLRA